MAGGSKQDHTEAIIIAGVALGAYLLVIKPLSNLFGQTPEEKRAIEGIDNSNPANNPFSYLFKPFQDLSYHINLAQAAIDAKARFDQLDSIPPITFQSDMDIAIAAEAVHDTFGWSNLYTGFNTEDLMTLFRAIPNQIFISAMDAYLFFNYNKSLWQYLKGGNFATLHGFSSDDLLLVINEVLRKPVK